MTSPENKACITHKRKITPEKVDKYKRLCWPLSAEKTLIPPTVRQAGDINLVYGLGWLVTWEHIVGTTREAWVNSAEVYFDNVLASHPNQNHKSLISITVQAVNHTNPPLSFICAYATSHMDPEHVEHLTTDVAVMETARQVFGIKGNEPAMWYIYDRRFVSATYIHRSLVATNKSAINDDGSG